VFVDIKQQMDNPVVHRIISYAAFDGSPEAVAKTVQKYQTNPRLHFYAWIKNDEILGICGYEVHANKVEIHLISVDEHARAKGVGGSMIISLQNKYDMTLEAETDDDAVIFYRKCGFETTEFMHKKRGKRHTCLLHTVKGV
jgi:ribosomal protein S18 acetylase RimI-like enzyme